MDERIKTIADHYGGPHQLMKAQEELRELDEAIEDMLKNGYAPCRIEHIIEELVDVSIMLCQIIYLYRFTRNEMRCYKDFKLSRQINRIKEEDE